MFATQKITHVSTQIGVLSVTVNKTNVRAWRPLAVKVRKQAFFAPFDLYYIYLLDANKITESYCYCYYYHLLKCINHFFLMYSL